MYTSLLRDEPLVPIVQRLLGDFYGYLRRDPGRPDGRPRPARARGAPHARGDRPRARVPDLALADPRAAADRRRCRRADVRARRGRRGGLAQVALDRALGTHLLLVGVLARAARGLATAQEIPQLVELDPDRAEALGVTLDDLGVVGLGGRALLGPELALLGLERLDAVAELFLVHGPRLPEKM